jgi:hypothetical protein
MIDQNDPNAPSKTPLAWALAVYPIVGLICGTACMIDGASLFHNDLNGPAYLAGGGPTPLLACMPGIALFVVGICLAYLTKAKMPPSNDRSS